MSAAPTVLLVEDNPADAYLTKIAFREAHVRAEVDHVVDGVEALAYLRREGAFAAKSSPALILLDLNMPRMDGKTFLTHVKEDPQFKCIPVVVLTTSSADVDVMSSYRVGAAGFITKPVMIDELVEALRRLGDYWFTLVRLPTAL